MSEVRYQAPASTDRARRIASPWWGVHAARYRFALAHIDGGRVLDVACGSGYGLRILKTRARLVVGIDVDAAVVRDVQKETSAEPGRLLAVADAARLPFPARSFAAVTSFETLEHLRERRLFISELARVLKPDGVCILSTPNANHTRPQGGKPRNPHHVFEYTPSQLFGELRPHFSAIRLLGQTLDSRFPIPPFADEQALLPRETAVQARLLIWRVLNKLPVVLREAVSATLWRRPFFPGDSDYSFSESALNDAPVQVAICRGTDSTEGRGE